MDYFVNRDSELAAFRSAMAALGDKNEKPPILLFHGKSGMGKTWLLKQCQRLAAAHSKKPLTMYLDCNQTNMSLEVLFNDIHTQLEQPFKKYFDEYIEFLEMVAEIEKKINHRLEPAGKFARAASGDRGVSGAGEGTTWVTKMYPLQR